MSTCATRSEPTGHKYTVPDYGVGIRWWRAALLGVAQLGLEDHELLARLVALLLDVRARGGRGVALLLGVGLRGARGVAIGVGARGARSRRRRDPAGPSRCARRARCRDRARRRLVGDARRRARARRRTAPCSRRARDRRRPSPSSRLEARSRLGVVLRARRGSLCVVARRLGRGDACPRRPCGAPRRSALCASLAPRASRAASASFGGLVGVALLLASRRACAVVRPRRARPAASPGARLGPHERARDRADATRNNTRDRRGLVTRRPPRDPAGAASSDARTRGRRSGTA